MIDDIFIFDSVIHRPDISAQNVRDDESSDLGVGLIIELNASFLHGAYAQMDYRRRFSVEDMHRMVFEESPTDMAMAQTVPLFEFFEDWYAPVMLQYELAQAYPEQIMFCGGVDPLYRGLDDALEQMEFQVKELGARSIKFYNMHAQESWRCDDEKVAYPLYEKARELGIKVIQFHKGVPTTPGLLEDSSPLDLQRPLWDFRDLTFVIHHLAWPYVTEAINVASRFPNCYLALSGNIQFLTVAPKLAEQWLGECLQKVGSDRLLWGSEAAPMGPPAHFLETFMEFEISDEMQAGYGYPQITRDDKEKILGLNFAQLMGVDVQSQKERLASVTAR